MVPGDVSKGPWGIPAKTNFKLSGHLIFALYYAHLKGFVSWKVSSRGHVHINTEYQNVSKSLVRGWSWHRLRRITGQLVFYYGQITASLIHPPATGHCQLRGWLLGIHKTTQLLFVYQHQKSEITTTDKSLYYIYFWALHVKLLCNLSHLYCCTACWDGLLKVPLSTIPQSTCWGSILVLGTQPVLR